MSVAAVKIKIMPKSPESDLAEIEKEVRTTFKSYDVRNPQFEIEPIAFGLKAIIVLFGWPETKELEELETSLKKIHHVGSVDVIDIRRAIG